MSDHERRPAAGESREQPIFGKHRSLGTQFGIVFGSIVGCVGFLWIVYAIGKYAFRRRELSESQVAPAESQNQTPKNQATTEDRLETTEEIALEPSSAEAKSTDKTKETTDSTDKSSSEEESGEFGRTRERCPFSDLFDISPKFAEVLEEEKINSLSMISIFENAEIDEFLKRHQEKLKKKDLQNMVRLIALARIIACQLTLQKISEKKQNLNGSSSICKLCHSESDTDNDHCECCTTHYSPVELSCTSNAADEHCSCCLLRNSFLPEDGSYDCYIQQVDSLENQTQTWLDNQDDLDLIQLRRSGLAVQKQFFEKITAEEIPLGEVSKVQRIIHSKTSREFAVTLRRKRIEEVSLGKSPSFESAEDFWKNLKKNIIFFCKHFRKKSMRTAVEDTLDLTNHLQKQKFTPKL